MEIDEVEASRNGNETSLDVTAATVNTIATLHLPAHNQSDDDSQDYGSMLVDAPAHMPAPRSASPRFRSSNNEKSHGTCRLLDLPAELRELVWIHAVTEWAPPSPEDKQSSSLAKRIRILEKRPIRMDRFNRPLPPAITRVSREVQNETLPLYYQQNIFECWRPLFWLGNWSVSTLIDWLSSLEPREVGWLRHIVLLYKNKDELEYDVEDALLEQGFEFNDCTITNKLELSEYEQCFEELGLPRHFGKKRRNDRYGIVHAGGS